MNIGIVTTWFERGAAYVSKQFEEVLSKENNVFIYARGGEKYAKGDPKWDKENVYWGKKFDFPLIPTYIDEKDFLYWINENCIDTVLFNEQNWWQILAICKKNKIKIGAYIDYYTESTVPLFNIYDFLICNTKRHYLAFSDHPQVFYVPWGTNTELFSPQETKKENDNQLVYFHSAGMSPTRKGTDFVIKAFEILTKSYENIRLIIHTQVSLNSAIPELSNTINKLVDNKLLYIIEKTVSAPGLYHYGDVYVYPTRLEGIGLTIAEALACGLPVITSDSAPMNEFITDPSSLVSIKKFYFRKDGYYWPMCEVSIKDLVSKMSFYIDSFQHLDEFKQQSRKYALEKLNWKNNQKHLLEIFTKVKTLPLSNDIVKAVNKKDNEKDSLFSKYPLYYNRIMRLINKIRK